MTDDDSRLLVEHLRAIAEAGFGDDDPSILRHALLGSDREYVVGLRGLARRHLLTADDVRTALHATSPEVRREILTLIAAGSEQFVDDVCALLGDDDPLVVDAAAFALGEWCSPSAAAPLAHVASAHDDARCREAAVAALGAIGDLSTLEVVLAALGDKPPVRRRAVVALAGFDDPRVEEALATMSEDRDWQTRAAASRLRD